MPNTSSPRPQRMTVTIVPSGTGIVMPAGSTPEDFERALQALYQAVDLMDEALDATNRHDNDK